MDVDAFERMLDVVVDQSGVRPGHSDVVDRVVADVRGMSTPAALSVLRTAVCAMAPDELYLEVGSYRGRSLCGALTGAERRGVAIENFSEFPESPAEAAAELRSSLERWGVAELVTMIDGDAFDLLTRLSLAHPVGVYFYDGVHSGWAQYSALGLAEHLLADRALVIIDDATWPQVAAATDSYVEAHPGYRLLHDFRAHSQEDPVWCNGLRVYEWNRSTESGALGRDIRIRAALQRRVDTPLRRAAWRTLSSHPAAFETLRRVATRGRTQVPGDPP